MREEPARSSRFSKPETIMELVLLLPLNMYHAVIRGMRAKR
jgi:hypothetical protein